MGILGPHRGVKYAMMSMVLYFVFLAAAAYVGMCSAWQWPLYLVGACACALAVAHLGAGLGPWADRTTVLLCSEAPGLAFADVSAKLLANYAVIVYVVQTALMLMLSALQLAFGWPESQIISIYGVLCLASIAIMAATREPPAASEATDNSLGAEEDGEDVKGKEGKLEGRSIRMVLTFYQDPRAILLAVLPLATGCMSSWKTAGLSSLLKYTLGQKYIGIVMIAQTAATIVFSKLFEQAIHALSVEAVMLVGSVACVAGPALYLFTDLAFQGWWILIFFVTVGLVWAVYDTAARTIVLRHFHGELSAVAFSSVNMLTFLGGMVFYFMDVLSAKGGSTSVACGGPGAAAAAASAKEVSAGVAHRALERDPTAELEAWVVLVLGLMVMPCLLVANRLEARRRGARVTAVAAATVRCGAARGLPGDEAA
eukprot:SRR837773.24767.p2 GENE.SRR837773.24767~~SRR837773.24767.p2  ORF type:complete len:486 (-),score=145.42 SRR837773.24767:96-1376(-)